MSDNDTTLKGTVEPCPECDDDTPHLTAAKDGWPVCVRCVTVHPPAKEDE